MSASRKDLPPPDTRSATSVLSQRFSMRDDAPQRPVERPATPDGPPTGILSVPTNQVAENPWNTRDVTLRPAKIEELAKSMEAIGQLQACPVVTREAYLRIFPPGEFPEKAQAIGDARYVQVPGARRRAAAVLAGRELEIVVKDNLAETRQKFLDATLAENIDRQDLDPIEEALAVEQLVMEPGRGPDGSPVRGAIAAVARRRSRSDAWVHQNLNLLKLQPEVQDALRADDPNPRLPVRDVRKWHSLTRDEQLEKLAAWQRRHDPQQSQDPPAEAEPPKPRISRTRAVLLRLGDTPVKMVHTIRAELSDEERRIWVEELSREEAPASDS